MSQKHVHSGHSFLPRSGLFEGMDRDSTITYKTHHENEVLNNHGDQPGAGRPYHLVRFGRGPGDPALEAEGRGRTPEDLD